MRVFQRMESYVSERVMTPCRTFYFAFFVAVMAFVSVSWAGEEGVGDPLREEIKALAALRVGDHAATVLETQEAFDALFERYGGTPLDRIRLVDFYFQDILLKRRPQCPLSLFRALAEQGDALIRQVDGDAALQARFQLFPLWIPVDLSVFTERARALLAASRDRPDPWPERRREVWRRLIQSLWDKSESSAKPPRHASSRTTSSHGKTNRLYYKAECFNYIKWRKRVNLTTICSKLENCFAAAETRRDNQGLLKSDAEFEFKCGNFPKGFSAERYKIFCSCRCGSEKIDVADGAPVYYYKLGKYFIGRGRHRFFLYRDNQQTALPPIDVVVYDLYVLINGKGIPKAGLDVYAGTPIAATYKLEPNDFFGDYASTISWNVGGNPLKNWMPQLVYDRETDKVTQTQSISIPLTEKNNATCNFFFYKLENAEIKATLEFPRGLIFQSANMLKSIKPEVRIEADPFDHVFFDPNGGSSQYQGVVADSDGTGFGFDPARPGIRLSVFSPPKVLGQQICSYAWIQLASVNRSRTIGVQPPYVSQVKKSPSMVLDGIPDVGVFYPSVPNNDEAVRLEDSPMYRPNKPDSERSYAINEEFSAFLLYRPGDNGFWVPLRKINWKWGRSASFVMAGAEGASDQWTSSLNSMIATEQPCDDAPAEEYPHWTSHVSEYFGWTGR